jgi:signal transduction histidine kinase
MRKIVRQQNYLRELIESQGNRFLTKQALKCLVRSVLEPLLDTPETGVVLYRIEQKDGLQGLLKRLEFSDIEAVDYSDKSNNLIEKVWAKTEFICVMTHRFVAILIWDYNSGDKNTVRYYSLYNSKLQTEPLDIIQRNSKVDISPYKEKFTPDRRDNMLLNASLRKLLENLEESANDAVLGYAEKSAGTLIDSDYAQKKSRVIAHEIKNQLSICDLYSGIIKKHIEKKDIDKNSILNALKAIDKSISMANNSLLSLKTKENSELKPVILDEIIENAVSLAGVYTDGRDINLHVEKSPNVEILADSEKLTAVLINLIKNAVEAFPVDETTEDTSSNGKYIKIAAEKEEDFAVIMVSNNAPGIKEPEKIFNEGFTTKTNGSGLGLWICKKSIEEQLGQLELSRSGEDYTEFTIRIGLVS